MRAMAGDETGLLRRVQMYNAVLLSLMFAGTWYIFSWRPAVGVLIGGLIASASFALLSRDIRKLMDSVTRAGTNSGSIKRIAKVRLLFNFYLRLGVIALVLYALNARMPIHMVGLATGLSTVMLSVVIAVLCKGSATYSVQRFKGA